MGHSVVESSFVNITISKLESSLAVGHIILPNSFVLRAIIELPYAIPMPLLSFYDLPVALYLNLFDLTPVQRLVRVHFFLYVFIIISSMKILLQFWLQRQRLLLYFWGLLLHEIDNRFHWLKIRLDWTVHLWQSRLSRVRLWEANGVKCSYPWTDLV